MTWAIPDWYALTLLAFAAYRAWHLIAEDTILDRPRAWLTERMPKGEEFVTCPWCSGAYFSIGWWLAWTWQPHWTLVAAVPFAISALVALIAAHEPG